MMKGDDFIAAGAILLGFALGGFVWAGVLGIVAGLVMIYMEVKAIG